MKIFDKNNDLSLVRIVVATWMFLILFVTFPFWIIPWFIKYKIV